MVNSKTSSDEYSADTIHKLEYPYSIWKRPSMYLGERGTQQTVGVREIIDNAVHECIRGFATQVRVVFGEDGSVTVQDNGRGLPVDINKKLNTNGIILTMATLHAGANFSTDVAAGKAGAGLNGVGASATNALSKKFDAIVYKGEKEHRLSFKDGFAGHFSDENPDSSFTESVIIKSKKDPRSAKEKKGWENGTKIVLWFNPDRFPKDEAVDIDNIVDRLMYTSFLVPKLQISVEDRNRKYEDGSFYTWSFCSQNGLPELIEVLSVDPVLPGSEIKGDMFSDKGIHYLKTSANYKEFASDEQGHNKEVTRTVTAELAFRYGTGYERNVVSFVNTIHTHLGGVHEKSFEKAFLKSVGERLNSMRGILTAKDEPPILEDYFEGMTAAISVNVPEPQFIGQEKEKLSGPEVEKALTKALTELFGVFANSTANQKSLKPMFEKIVQASKNRQAAQVAKLAKRKANKLSSSALPLKLADCDVTGSEESELIICEGDSAAGTVKKARDATFQAVIPIRGKILNAHKAGTAAIMKNKEVMDIAQAIGAGFGQNFDIDKIRYGKILFAADADVDGLEINNLLFTVFNRLFREMVEEGRVYQTVPPLFEVSVKNARGTDVIYVSNETELKQVLLKLDKQKKTYKIERNKGLGEMDPQSFFDTVLNPEKRTLKRITIGDLEKAEEALNLTMGDDPQERKDFMGENFQVAIDSGLVDGYEEGNE